MDAGGLNIQRKIAVIDASRLGPRTAFEVNIPPIKVPIPDPVQVRRRGARALARPRLAFGGGGPRGGGRGGRAGRPFAVCRRAAAGQQPAPGRARTVPARRPRSHTHPAARRPAPSPPQPPQVEVIPPGQTIVDLTPFGSEDNTVVALPDWKIKIPDPVHVIPEPGKVHVSAPWAGGALAFAGARRAARGPFQQPPAAALQACAPAPHPSPLPRSYSRRPAPFSPPPLPPPPPQVVNLAAAQQGPVYEFKLPGLPQRNHIDINLPKVNFTGVTLPGERGTAPWGGKRPPRTPLRKWRVPLAAGCCTAR